MLEDSINTKPPPDTFALRVHFLFDDLSSYEDRIVELTPSFRLRGESTLVHEEELPPLITKALSMLKMLSNGERIGVLGKRYTDSVFYVYVRIDDWVEFLDGLKPREK